MLVLSANKSVRAIVELDEADMKALRKEYKEVSVFKCPTVDDLVAQIIDLNEDGDDE